MRVLAINDVSCVGKCSLTVSLPIISACGVTCDVLPTALLSTHTGGFTGYTFLNLTSEIPDIVRHWKSLGLRFDYIYSGYLGDAEQIDLVENIKNEFLAKNGKFIVDPVMGDSGKLYANFTNEFVAKMRELCKQADFILPNLTEACFLADLPYPKTGQAVPVEKLTQKIAGICPRPIITGIVENDTISIYYLDENGAICRESAENIQGFFHGSGDVFASAFVGALARGKDERTAIRLCTQFLSATIRRSAQEVTDSRYGLNFEAEIYTFLQNLNG
ncbi:MAG: pyridoxamine kinase [Clostridia bacterium]|nr:pyridoxamine kinase [Clostridia bacterium]